MAEKPEDIQQYPKWLEDGHGVRLDRAERNYYGVATRALRDHVESSSFWERFQRQLPELDDGYYQMNGVHLLMGRENPSIKVKPFDSQVDKSFRKNVLLNTGWPDPPKDGWVLPDNWLTTIKDVVRACVVVKYLDGVIFLSEKIAELAGDLDNRVTIDYEAREEGYYAAHTYIELRGEIPLRKWDTEEIVFSLELQITTQMQEAIRTLTHPFYVARRSRPPAGQAKKWQWDYESSEFRANYLAHTLHHLEGLVMDLRAKRRDKE